MTDNSPNVVDEIKEHAEKIEEAKAPAELKPEFEGIAILGSHPATVEQAPFDKNWLIYACSPHNIEERTLPRVDEWFEIHLPVTHPTRKYEYLRRLEDNNLAANPPHCKTIWARDPQFIARCRDARPYPEKELKQRFGPFFFTSSIAFMMAKAIVDCERLGIPAIGIFGVIQASQTEYEKQRPGLQYFIQRAAEIGISIQVPEKMHVEAPGPSQVLFTPPVEDF